MHKFTHIYIFCDNGLSVLICINNLNIILLLQKQATQTALKLKYADHVGNLFKSLKILTVYNKFAYS